MVHNITPPNEELMHYGVIGMKWGVRRARKRLSKADTDEAKAKATAVLKKHREKATAEVAKLKKERKRLQKDVDKYITKKDAYAIKLQKKATKAKRKATSRFVSKDRSQELLMKSMRLEAKAEKIKNRSATAKNKLEKNAVKTREFERGISKIDKTLRKK